MLLTLFALLFFASQSLATGVAITNFGPSNYDSEEGLVTFRADVAWNKAWRSDFNHDALWIFMKVWNTGLARWLPGRMSTSGLDPEGFSAPAGFEIIVPEDKSGFFLRLGPGRSASTAQNPNTEGSGIGSVTFTWDYQEARTENLAPDLANAATKFRLYAIEMVYIPEGSFTAGDSTSTSVSTYGFRYGLASTAATPTFLPFSGWPINSEESFYTAYVGAGIQPGSGPFYYYTSTDADLTNENPTGGNFFVQGEYPKGYKAFYLMKYEISQGQYRDFLNTLQPGEYIYRCAGAQTASTTGIYCDSVGSGAGSSARQGVQYISSTAAAAAGTAFACALSSANGVNGTDDGEWVAMNYLSWMDLDAYLDWAGLRPITELEFEKAARGPVASTLGEYPWGTTADPTGHVSYTALNSDAEGGDGRRAEYIAGAGTWPIRVGSFATSSLGAERALVGAGYYGNLDLAGNVWEMVVNIGTVKGRNFQGSHGDGFLSADSRGAGDNIDWPGWTVGVGITALPSAGIGLRGGSWNTTLAPLRISDRTAACSSAWVATRTNDVGGRGGRTAPTFAAPTKPQ